MPAFHGDMSHRRLNPEGLVTARAVRQNRTQGDRPRRCLMQIEACTNPDGLGAVFERVLRPAFRPGELSSAEQLQAGVASGRCEVLVALDGGEPQATAIGEFGDGVVLLAYLAVARGLRSRGLGGVLLDAAVGRWRARPGIRLVLAEVDRPDFQQPDPLQGDPQRRLEFYARHGGLALDLPYFQPSLGEGRPREYGMLLITLGADPSVLSPDGTRLADTDLLRRHLQGALGPGRDGDTTAARVFERLDNPGGVALLPLGEYARIEASVP
jgi:GNAT superfamily N-acetyltransferase